MVHGSITGDGCTHWNLDPNRIITFVLTTFNLFKVNYLEIGDSKLTVPRLTAGYRTKSAFESSSEIDIAQDDGFQFYGFISESDSNGVLKSIGALLYNPTSLNA